jgi:hypothetical protein
VAVITHEVWTCDFCGKPIASGKGLKGTLTLRKQGVKGIGRRVVIALHDACNDKLTRNAGSRP